jgi:hypothetical protein
MTRLALLASLAACSTRAAAPKPDAAPPFADNGGAILVRNNIYGFELVAELFESATPDALPALAVGDGHCDVQANAAPPPVVVDRDLGPTITALSGDVTLVANTSAMPCAGGCEFVAPVAHSGAVHYYASQLVPPTMRDIASSWSVGDAAGALVTVRVPGVVRPFLNGVTYTRGAPAEIMYTGGEDADYIELDVGGAICYAPGGSTSFTIPAAVLDAVATSSVVNVVAIAHATSVVAIDGSAVLVHGVADDFD